MNGPVMTTTTTLGICPRCGFDEYQEYRREEWARFRAGFLAGFLITAAVLAVILMALWGGLG